MGYIGPRGISLDEWTAWSDYAQSAALAWQARESDACPQGHHRDVWDPEAGGRLLAEVRLKARVCPACEYAERHAPDPEERWPGEYRAWEPLAGEDPHDDEDAEQGEERGDDEEAAAEGEAQHGHGSTVTG